MAIVALVAWSALVVSGHPIGLSLARSASTSTSSPPAHLVTYRQAAPAPATTAATTTVPTTVPALTTTLPPKPVKPVAPPTTAPAPTTTAAPVVRAASAPVVPPTTAATAQPSSYGCAAALQYLAANSAPGFHFECPGYADGHQAMTCINEAGLCPNESLIAISDPCPAAYMNEAHNSWVLAGLRPGSIDPYGYCH